MSVRKWIALLAADVVWSFAVIRFPALLGLNDETKGPAFGFPLLALVIVAIVLITISIMKSSKEVEEP